MYNRLLNKDGKKKDKVIINFFKTNFHKEVTSANTKTKRYKLNWLITLFNWFFLKILLFLKWLWSHPKKLITSILTAICLWLLSFLPFKLPNLPFLPIPAQQSKSQENKKDDKKPEETKKDDKKDDKKDESKPTEQSKTNIVTTTITNTVTQTNIITQTNYVNQTLYVTNFVVQPIVVTNTVIKEVPVTVTNVLVIKNSISETNNGAKNKVMNGPAFFFTDDFNTLLQNQQQNPVKGQMVN